MPSFSKTFALCKMPTPAGFGALLDRLTHRVHILEANGQSYRLSDAKRRLKRK